MLTGQTRITPHRTHAFVESAQQVARDIEAAYRHVIGESTTVPYAEGESRHEDIAVAEGTHLIDGGLVDEMSDKEPLGRDGRIYAKARSASTGQCGAPIEAARQNISRPSEMG